MPYQSLFIDPPPEDRSQPAPSTPSVPKKRERRRVSKRLVALSSAAILTVYAVGYVRTQAAASEVAAQEAAASTLARGAPTAPPPTAVLPTPRAVAPRAQAPGRSSPRGSNPAGPGGAGQLPAPAATPSTAAPPAAAAPAAPTGAYRDGTFVGLGTSRHGNIEATVVIKGGKIVSAEISQCLTRYPCSYIAALPGQVVARQAAKVDLVSRATDSSVAYRAAVTKALAQAQAT